MSRRFPSVMVAFANPWGRALVTCSLAACIVLWAMDAGAQTPCPPARILHGQVNPADGSTPPSPASVSVTYCAGSGSGWGTVQVCPHYSAACQFSSGHFNYFGQSTTEPTAWCTGGDPPAECHPQDQDVFDFSLYSTQGYVYGTVTRMPTGQPVVGTQVLIQRQFPNGGWSFDCGGRSTDASGNYTFKSPLNGPNNWGCLLNPPASPGSPGTANYRSGGSTLYDYGYTTIQSNTFGRIDLVMKDPGEGYEEPGRCGSQEGPQSPSPSASSSASAGPSNPVCRRPQCAVGSPVSVTTGNVDLDQTDAVIPGVGLGLRFSRSYNSKNIDAGEYDAFGPGWSHSYEKRLTFHGSSSRVIKLRDGEGMPFFYQDVDNNDGVFLASMPFTKESRIVRISATEYRLVYQRGGSETYLRPGGTGSARLASLTDASGNVTTLTYDAATAGGRLISIADPGGRQLTLAYQGSSRQPVSLSGPGGPIATFAYAPAGSLPMALQSVTYADGDGDAAADGAFTFAYHPHGRLWTVTDGAGKVLETHVYTGERATQTSRSGDVEKYTLVYDDVYNTTTVTDSQNHVTTYHWRNVWGVRRITKIAGPCSGCGGGGGDVQEWTYDLQGRVTSHKDGEGNVTGYAYDRDGNLITVTPPQVGSTPAPTTYTFYPDGRVHTRSAPNGNVTTWTYVAAGPATITETVSPGFVRTTGITYTSQGKPEIITDPLSQQTVMGYTVLGDLEWVRDPLGHQTSFEYDAMGRREKSILPATTPPNGTPRTSYDTLGRVWRVTNPNDSYWRHWYDGGGRRILTRDPHDERTHFQYDTYGRLWKIVDPLGGETEYGYDLMSNRTSLSDARDKTTSFAYDGHHRVKKVVYPSLTKPQPFEEFTYDLAGRLKTRKDRKGVTTTFAHDARGRLTGKTYSDGSPAVTFGYDANNDIGFMTSASNSADSLAWDFDLAGQLQSEASTRNASSVSYVYDLAGRRTKLRLNGTDVLTYGYQADGQLDTIARAANIVFDFNPDAAHRRQSVVFPNNTTTEYEYDLPSRLSRIRLKRGPTVLSDIAYESNDLNTRTARTEDGKRLEYGYDELSRLLAVDRMVPWPTVRQEEYSYDPVGNRQTALGIPGLWTYGEGNELLSYNGITFAYDLNGNQTSRSGSPARTYVWDVEDRLASARDNGVSVASFEYDPLGRRVAKTTSLGTTLFTYDSDDILVENGTSGVNLYVHGPGIDEPLARGSVTGILTRFYHLDGLNSLIKRTDSNGNVENSRTYDSFGNPTVAPPSGHAFTSREWDSESGLYFYRARYYDARIGRFLSQDPLRHRAGTNLYQYVRNRPTQFRDPMGLLETPTQYPESCIYRKDSCKEDSCDCETWWLRSRECPSISPDDNKLCYFKWTRAGCLDRGDECPGAPEIDEITPLPPPGFRYFETMDPCFESEEPPQEGPPQ